MAIDYSVLPLSKGMPRVGRKMLKDRRETHAERECYAKVDLRDGRRCRFPGCKKAMRHHHHIVPRSLGGKHRTREVCSLCVSHHSWCHGDGLVKVEGNADKKTGLRWTLTSYGMELGLQIQKVAA